MNARVNNKPERAKAFESKVFTKHIVYARKGGERQLRRLLDIEGLAQADQDFADFSEDFIRRRLQIFGPKTST